MTPFSTREAARILDVTETQVRSFARLGAVVPRRNAGGRLGFSFQDMVLLKTTKGLVDAGVPLPRLRRVWSSLRRQLAAGLPLTGITIYADGDRAVAWDGRARWQPDSGQFLLQFDPGVELIRAVEASALGTSAAAKTEISDGGVALLEADPEIADPPAPSAEQWFHLAGELEAGSPREARQAYHQALLIDPDFADAHLNLGRLDHEDGRHQQAEAHYREAIRCAPKDATCWFNLGVLLEDRRRRAEAVHAYDQAVLRDPDLADAHYNLGLLHEALGNRPRAMKHLMIARGLYAKSGRGT